MKTYRKFKENYHTEQYVKVITQKRYRSAYAKFRCGVAPIKLETCRYGLNRMPVDQRLCESCNVVEDECRGLPRIWEGGGGQEFFFRYGNLHVAAMRIDGGVLGHAPPRKYFKMVQFGAF